MSQFFKMSSEVVSGGGTNNPNFCRKKERFLDFRRKFLTILEDLISMLIIVDIITTDAGDHTMWITNRCSIIIIIIINRIGLFRCYALALCMLYMTYLGQYQQHLRGKKIRKAYTFNIFLSLDFGTNVLCLCKRNQSMIGIRRNAAR